MKKIVGTVLVGALVASMAFADVSFSYTGEAIVGGTSKKMNSVTRKDCFSIGASNEFSGMVFDADIENNKMSYDQFYGWLTFGLPVGSLQITTGKWDARYVSRITTDAGDIDSKYYEAHKPGVIYDTKDDDANRVIGKDVDNLTSSDYMGTVLAWTLSDGLPGALMIKAGLVGKNSDKYEYNPGGSTLLHSGFVGEICYAQDETIKANLVVKSYYKDMYTIAGFVSPLMVENLALTVGGTYSFSTAEDDDSSATGIDLRARYAVSEKLAITTMNNISMIDDGEDFDDKAMWNMLSVSYKGGDNIRFIATAQSEISSFNAAFKSACTYSFSPMCEIKLSENAIVTSGFDVRWVNKTPYAGEGDVSIPVYFSFSL